MDNQFGKRLAHARAAKNLTQRELADKIGITWSQISRYEAGKAKPRLAVAMKLAEALGIDAGDLSGGQEEGSGREISFNISAEHEAKIHEFAKKEGVSFDAAVQLVLAQGLKEKLDADANMLAKLEQDIPGAYEKLVELLRKD